MEVIRTSMREQAKEVILRRIADGTLQPGQRIVEGDLTRDLQVSNIPVREAIRELTAIGVLASAHHKGAWVRVISVVETIDALHVKAALEPKAVLLAGDRLQQRSRELRESIAGIVAAAQRQDFTAYQEYNQRFHRTIVEASGNRLLIKLWESLAFEIRTSFIMTYISEQDPVAIAKEHTHIADAIEAGDYQEAASLLARHADSLVAYLEQQLGQEKGLGEDSEICTAFYGV